MKTLLFILFTAIGCAASFCQITQYNYVGVQTFESGEFTTYQLDIEFFENIVQGRVYVDIGGPDESLYYIKGFYNEQANFLQFRASYLVWTKSDVAQNEHCILNFLSPVKNLKTVKAFSGPYTSRTDSKEVCAKGLLILSRVFNPEKDTPLVQEETPIAALETSQENKVLKPKSQVPKPKETVSTPQQALPVIANSNLPTTPIRKDENLNVFVKNKTITLFIYDAGKVDNDRISISINGKIVLDDYSIQEEKRELDIVLKEGKSVIEVTALNEGTKPPNTVKVELLDGDNLITTRTSLKEGESASLTLLHDK